MAIAPLPGPVGLYNVSVMPRFLLDSSRVGWQGAYFTEIQGAPTGRVDHDHERYCIQRGLQVEARSRLPGGSWCDVPIGFQAWQAGDECRFEWQGGGRAQFLFVSPERAEVVLGHLPRRLAPQAHQRSLRSRALELMFDALSADLAQGSPAGPLVGDSLIAAALAQLAGAHELSPGPLGVSARERAIEYMETHFAEPVSLQDLAAAAGTGVRQFCRAFRAATGVSPHQYLLQRRVEHAKSLIAKDLPLADVAQQCGFADQSQLTRTFARHVGTTPGRYRALLTR